MFVAASRVVVVAVCPCSAGSAGSIPRNTRRKLYCLYLPEACTVMPGLLILKLASCVENTLSRVARTEEREEKEIEMLDSDSLSGDGNSRAMVTERQR